MSIRNPFVPARTLALGALLAALGGTPAWAADITVNSLADAAFPTPGDGQCTLREAVANANFNNDGSAGDCVPGSGADTITFSVGGTITLANATLAVLDADGLTIDGTDKGITIDGNRQASGPGGTRVFSLNFGAVLHLRRLTVTKGTDADDPTGGGGGAIFNAGTTSVTDSTFFSNFAAVRGGAIVNNGSLTVANSTFVGNDASIGGSSGGAIFNRGTLVVSNSTISANSTNSPIGVGGGLHNEGTATVINSTFSGNSVNSGRGGGIRNVGTLNLANTIVANSSGGDCLSTGILNASGVNLIEDGSCGSGFPADTDPKLGELADNGGPTQTHALLAGSPAIDAGDNAVCAAAPVNNLDQRGVRRPGDGNNDGNAVCDVGAFEVPSPGTRICSLLGDRRGFLDVDVFRFSGAKDEEVTLTLDELASAGNRGTRAGLLLVSGVPKVLLVRADASDLPNSVAAKLPATGRYFVSVSELPQHLLSGPFRGNYCVTLRSSMDAASSFEATETVETVLP